jgi:hypothetical protein
MQAIKEPMRPPSKLTGSVLLGFYSYDFCYEMIIANRKYKSNKALFIKNKSYCISVVLSF